MLRLDFLSRSVLGFLTARAREGDTTSVDVVVPGNGVDELHGNVQVRVSSDPTGGIRSLWLQVDNDVVADSQASPLTYTWDTNKSSDGAHLLEGDVQYRNHKAAQDRLVVNVNNSAPAPQRGRDAVAGLVYLFGGGF